MTLQPPLPRSVERSALEGEAFVSRLELSSFAQVLPSGNVMPSLPFHVPVTSFGPPLANVAASAHSLTGSPALHAPSEPAPSAPVTLPAVTETVRVQPGWSGSEYRPSSGDAARAGPAEAASTAAAATQPAAGPASPAARARATRPAPLTIAAALTAAALAAAAL